MKKQPKLTIQTYNKLWINNRRMKVREERLRKIIGEAWRLLDSRTKKYR